MHTLTLTTWEIALFRGKVLAELLVYAGHKANGLRLSKKEDDHLEALKALDEKFESAAKEGK